MKLPSHLFVSTDGGLYDTRQPDWHKLPPLRAAYDRHCQTIDNVADFKACIRAGAFAWPGGYPLYFVAADGAAISFDGARANFREIVSAIQTNDRHGGWRVVALDTNWEDPDLHCEATGARIESAHAEPDSADTGSAVNLVDF